MPQFNMLIESVRQVQDFKTTGNWESRGEMSDREAEMFFKSIGKG